MKTRQLSRLAEKLRCKHTTTGSWSKAAKACKVTTPDGRPNPKLAQLIAGGYNPRRSETRARLGLPPVCPCCNRRITAPRQQATQPRARPFAISLDLDTLAQLTQTAAELGIKPGDLARRAVLQYLASRESLADVLFSKVESEAK